MTFEFKQCVNSIVFKYFNEQCPNNMSEVFNVATESNIQLRGSFEKLKCPFCKTNNRQFPSLTMVQLFGTKPWKHSSTLTIIIPSAWTHNLQRPVIFLAKIFNIFKSHGY